MQHRSVNHAAWLPHVETLEAHGLTTVEDA